MSNRSIHRLRALYLANPSFSPDDPRFRTLWRRVKRAYASLSAPDRHPDKLDAALARAMTAMAPST